MLHAAKTETMPAAPVRSVSDLYKEFKTAIARAAMIPNDQETTFNRAVDKCSALAMRIVSAPAETIREVDLKIRIVGWCTGLAKGERLEDVDDWNAARFGDGEEFCALVSMRGDLQRMKAQAAA